MRRINNFPYCSRFLFWSVILLVLGGVTHTPAAAQVSSTVEYNTTKDTTFSQIIIDLPGLPEDARLLKMILIPAGVFMMGSPDSERSRCDREGPIHQVTIGSDFYLGETEVTQAQWQAVMGSNPSIYSGKPDNPVEMVNWIDCQTFIDTLNSNGLEAFRLPTEAEWEYACRAGTQTRFYFGDSLDCNDEFGDCAAGTLPGNRSDYMWYCLNRDMNCENGTHPVGQLIPNGFGLYDMSGNVYEWCQDKFQGDFYSTPEAVAVSPVCNKDSSKGRVYRGASWRAASVGCRSAFRNGSTPTYRANYLGFRLVMEVDPSSVEDWGDYQ